MSIRRIEVTVAKDKADIVLEVGVSSDLDVNFVSRLKDEKAR